MKAIIVFVVIAGFFISDGNYLQKKYLPVSPVTPDIIYHSGIIVTMDPAKPLAEALAIKDGRIMMVGDNSEILALQDPAMDSKLFDLKGLTVLPGFNDAHCHWFGWREHICTAHGEEFIEFPPLEEIMQDLSSNGWTSISELAFGWPGDASIEHLNNALALEASGHLSVRVNGYWGGIFDIGMFDALTDYPPDRYYSDRIRAQGIKMYVDDAFGTADILTQEEATALVERAHQDGWQIATHAVNLSGVEKILTAYETALGNESNELYRHRIEHAVKVNDQQLDRMLTKGIIASFQLMGPPDWPEQETHMNHISNTQPELQMRWREFVEADLPSVGSTDAPFNNTVCAYNPFLVIHQGVTRMGYLDREHAPWELDQRLTIAQCLKLLTMDGAYATREEDIKGSLTAGKYADLVVASKNPLDYEENPEELLDIQILQTMVGGVIEYCANNPCYNLCDKLEIIDLDSFEVSVSQYLPDQRPEAAFDQNAQSNWGAGAHPPQWIQIDLQRDRIISQINLTVSQFPSGPTVHQILAARSDESCELNLLHEFEGQTTDGQILTYEPPDQADTFRFLRIHTVESPSWVAWFEIDIQYADDMTTSTITLQPFKNNLEIIPNPVRDELHIRYQLIRDTPVTIDLLTLDGKILRELFSGKNVAGEYRLPVRISNDLAAGVYLIRIRSDQGIQINKLILTR